MESHDKMPCAACRDKFRSSENVIELHTCKMTEWKKDITEYLQGYKHGEPFSQKKDLFGYLICQFLMNENIPIECRREAGYVLYKYSDYRKALDGIYLERQNPTEIRKK